VIAKDTLTGKFNYDGKLVKLSFLRLRKEITGTARAIKEEAEGQVFV
jgi:hypothetical protein